MFTPAIAGENAFFSKKSVPSPSRGLETSPHLVFLIVRAYYIKEKVYVEDSPAIAGRKLFF